MNIIFMNSKNSKTSDPTVVVICIGPPALTLRLVLSNFFNKTFSHKKPF